MRVTRVEIRPLPLVLAEPYTIANEHVDHVDNLLLRLETDAGHVGLGIAAPTEVVTGEDLDACRRALTDVAEPLLHGADGLRRLPIVEALADALPGRPAARAAVDMALVDLLAKAAGLPVWRLFGGYRDHIATSMTVFITPIDDAVRRARAFVDDGFDVLKLKGGLDVDEDIARVRAVRAAVGPDVELRFDANQGYAVEQAVRLWRETRDARLSLLEQPTAAADHEALRRVAQGVHVPVMADESVLSLADAFHLARGDMTDMVNVKLTRVGGLDAALLINAVARAAGLEVMVGTMDECALSVASGLAFACCRRNVELADLDGHLDLLGDPTAAALTLRRGRLYPSEAPGFGLVDL